MTDAAVSGARELFEFDPERVACPYPTFAAMRDRAPVAWYDELEAFAVTRYDLIVEVLRHPEQFSSRSATGPAADRKLMTVMAELAAEDPEIAELAVKLMTEATAAVLLQADPPEHPRQRALVNRAFTPAAIHAIEPEIEALAQGLIDGFIDKGEVELISEFAIPLPMAVIAKAVGVGADRVDDFMGWSNTLVAGVGVRELGKDEIASILRTRAVVADYLLGLVAERTDDPRDDLISKLAHAEIEGERLTPAEVVSMVIQFLLAGNHTTAMAISTCMLQLAGDPELADRLRAEPDLVAPFLEEVLRTEPPVNGTYRIADAECELGGVHIPAGSALWLVYASGNRDPDEFPDPDAFQCPQASKSPHLTFGFGAHYCLGSSLARAEAQIALRALLDRCSDIRLGIDRADVAYDPSYMLHGLQSLPLTFAVG
ncbi:MAG TPA: cytochrome P450 [Acidimicrobiales bacterium]|jgi:cytochrome P450|nr:cytochrome P450 [Acidimicrobiales bacterium]